MRSIVLLVLATAACIKPPGDKSQTGPTIEVTLAPDTGSSTSSTSSSPGLTLPTGATSYSFKLIIMTDKGEAYDGDSYTYPDVTEAHASLTLTGANIPAITLDVDSSLSEWTYTSHDKITVPSSFKMQSMMVHADAKDASGLSSNILDFSCMLR
jgi:hypothetical protein